MSSVNETIDWLLGGEPTYRGCGKTCSLKSKETAKKLTASEEAHLKSAADIAKRKGNEELAKQLRNLYLNNMR